MLFYWGFVVPKNIISIERQKIKTTLFSMHSFNKVWPGWLILLLFYILKIIEHF